MRKVLIVSPHFPPVNAPDMQRVRLCLPHLRALGWEPTVLAVHPDSIEGGLREPLLESTYPADIRIERVRGIHPATTRRLGFGSLWLRCGRALQSAGSRLLQSARFDAVFFSTTQFDTFRLGPRWLRRFGAPYVLDYQDPWVNPYYERTRTRPPGGRLRFGFAQWRARRHEPRALRSAAGIVAVSDSYGSMLADRYPWFDPRRVDFLPFGASIRDIEIARRHASTSPLVPENDGLIHHVYAGRGGPDMATALTLLLRGFRLHLETSPGEARRLRFHFIGTSYAPAGLAAESVMPIARTLGVDAFVSEHPARIGYFDALSCLLRADAILALGSDDATYSASKIFPYLLAQRPLLLLYHRQSPVHAVAQQIGGGVRVAFDDSNAIESVAAGINEQWFAGQRWRHAPIARYSATSAHSAETMTSKLVQVFERTAVSSVS